MQIHRSIGSTAAALLLFLLWIGSASAHAQLHSATPAVGGTVSTAPAEVIVKFSESLEAAFSSVVVRDSVGKRVDKADAHLDPGDHGTMRVSLPPLTQGIYIVVWRTLTADTHKTEGAFIFRVGE